MEQNLQRILSSWRFHQSYTVYFTEIPTEQEICYRFPRPALDAFGKHFVEMAEGQKPYIKALETGKVDFPTRDYDQPEIHKKTSFIMGSWLLLLMCSIF